MVKPVCVPCGIFFHPEKNGFVFEEGKPDGCEPVRWKGKNPPDKSYMGQKPFEPENTSWSSYKLWVGDKWKCRGCGAEIVVGVIGERLIEHYQPDYEKVREQLGGDSILFVHDC